jgi:DNA-directed RNA polymerase specialized sigma24 family protein
VFYTKDFLKGKKLSSKFPQFPLNFLKTFASIVQNKLIKEVFRWFRNWYLKWIEPGAPVPGRCAKTSQKLNDIPGSHSGSEDPFCDLLEFIKEGRLFENLDTEQPQTQRLRQQLEKIIQYKFPEQDGDFYNVLLNKTLQKIWLKAHQFRGQTGKECQGWVNQIIYTTGLDLIDDDKKLDECVSIDSTSGGVEAYSKNDEENFCIDISRDNLSKPRPVEEEIVCQEYLNTLFYGSNLTKQERQVVMMLFDGYSKKVIADVLGVSKPRITQLIHQIQGKYSQKE